MRGADACVGTAERAPLGSVALPRARPPGPGPAPTQESAIAEPKPQPEPQPDATRAAAARTGTSQSPPQRADQLRELLRRPEYRRALVFCGLIGIPVSLAAFWFLALLHELEDLVWIDWPHHIGWSDPSWWWPFPLALVSGLLVSLVVLRFPGRGGHIPAAGLQAASGRAEFALPGVLVAALVSLPLGATLGPEAPLIALGGGLALLLRDLVRAPVTESGSALIGAAGSAAAMAAIFGNPLVAAVLLMEVAGVGGTQLLAIMLPALLCSGIGAIVFTGFGHWTGLKTDSLSLGLPAPPTLDVGDVGWSVLLAVVIGAAVHWIMTGGRWAAISVVAHPVRNTVLCALGAAGCAALYAVATGRSPGEVALSGQDTLSQLASDPGAWSIGSLVAVLAFKGTAYALCLGSLRGGPIFPALFLGGAAGVLAAPLPGYGTVPAMAAGMAASAAAALRLPVSTSVLVALLLGRPGSITIVILAAVISFTTTQLLPPAPAIPPFGGREPGGKR